jgi:hypothetical protein
MQRLVVIINLKDHLFFAEGTKKSGLVSFLPQ